VTHPPAPGPSWLLVVLFAVAMAWVEAACVYDLRVMVDRLQPYQANPLPMSGALGQVELVREVATLVMIAALGAVAGRTQRARLAYAAITFGVWDIFYYVWLKVISGWPTSLLDWDVLFLLPLPWWGPIIAPAAIALLPTVWGTLASVSSVQSPATAAGSRVWRVAGIGAALALYVFMADSLRAAPHGLQAVRAVVPKTFNWLLFLVALALMTVPVASLIWNVVPSLTTARFASRRYLFRNLD